MLREFVLTVELEGNLRRTETSWELLRNGVWRYEIGESDEREVGRKRKWWVTMKGKRRWKRRKKEGKMPCWLSF